MPKIKRSQIATYINTVPGGAADYALLGLGITDASISYNPDTLEETYIHEDSANIEVQGYAPEMGLEITVDSDDAAFLFLDQLRKDRAVLGGAETDIINVWLYESPTGDVYEAEQQPVSVSFDEFGGEGGQAAQMSATLHYRGDPVPGTFDVVLLTFTAT